MICISERVFAIQLHEFIDVTACAQLLIFAQYVGKETIKSFW